MDIQGMFDQMAKGWQMERAQSQMTLGELIAVLSAMPQDELIDKISHPHSYRGYYLDLAFEREEGKIAVADLLFMCKECLGETFKGYKGGDYTMQKATPVWIAFYGMTGKRIMRIENGGFVAEEEE